jgi:hypothetical protein
LKLHHVALLLTIAALPVMGLIGNFGRLPSLRGLPYFQQTHDGMFLRVAGMLSKSIVIPLCFLALDAVVFFMNFSA